MSARDTALSAMIACRKQKAWSDGILKEYIARDGLDRRDAALASRLCYGVLQNRMLLDHYLQQLITGKLKRLQPVVLDILRLGLYQILFLDKIPVSAAVNEAVEQTKKYANRSAAGLVNGVLRNADRQKDSLTPPQDLATKYSHPQALVDLLTEYVGEEKIESVLRADNETPDTVIQVNTLRAQGHQVQAALTAAGAQCRPHPWMPDCYLVTGAGNLEQLEAYQKGWFYVQDAASRLTVRCAGAKPGMRVLDCCAAPGGKSFAAAIDMNNEGKIRSADIHRHKITLVEKGALRLGLDCIHAREQDASMVHPTWKGKMDLVLADVPCSGFGIIRKKPDIRYKDLDAVSRLPELQLKILCNQAEYVKPGGVLMYSTCTLNSRENESVVRGFLKANPEFTLEPLDLPEVFPKNTTGMLRLLPGEYDTDGFFLAKLRRKA